MTVFRSYLAACTASIGVALLTRSLVSKWTRTMAGSLLFVFNALTAYAATASAGFLNAFMMRVTELQKGISVYDPSDLSKPVVTSRSAARRAVLQTATSRFILALPMLGPAFALFGIEKMGWMPKSLIGSTLVQMILFAIELYVALPLGISAYPPIGRIKPGEFKNDDKEVQNTVENYVDGTGQPAPYFQYNKGL